MADQKVDRWVDEKVHLMADQRVALMVLPMVVWTAAQTVLQKGLRKDGLSVDSMVVPWDMTMVDRTVDH